VVCVATTGAPTFSALRMRHPERITAIISQTVTRMRGLERGHGIRSALLAGPVTGKSELTNVPFSLPEDDALANNTHGVTGRGGGGRRDGYVLDNFYLSRPRCR